MRIVLASNNAGKLREFKALLDPLGLEVVPQGELGIGPAPEPFGTFLENALCKARHASLESGQAAIADDSGICVAALDGAPGVHSSRFSGENATDARNNELLMQKLEGASDRSAYYACVLVAVRHPEDPTPLVAQAVWRGKLLTAPRGANGFGYDPYFVPEGLEQTAAELAPEVKNGISHRGQAMRVLARLLRENWSL